MPFFSCGAIPHSFNRESPAEKMHAHLRSFSFYHKIVSKIPSKLCAISGKNKKFSKFRIVNYSSIKAEIFKTDNYRHFFCPKLSVFRPEAQLQMDVFNGKQTAGNHHLRKPLFVCGVGVVNLFAFWSAWGLQLKGKTETQSVCKVLWRSATPHKIELSRTRPAQM